MKDTLLDAIFPEKAPDNTVQVKLSSFSDTVFIPIKKIKNGRLTLHMEELHNNKLYACHILFTLPADKQQSIHLEVLKNRYTQTQQQLSPKLLYLQKLPFDPPEYLLKSSILKKLKPIYTLFYTSLYEAEQFIVETLNLPRPPPYQPFKAPSMRNCCIGGSRKHPNDSVWNDDPVLGVTLTMQTPNHNDDHTILLKGMLAFATFHFFKRMGMSDSAQQLIARLNDLSLVNRLFFKPLNENSQQLNPADYLLLLKKVLMDAPVFQKKNRDFS